MFGVISLIFIRIPILPNAASSFLTRPLSLLPSLQSFEMRSVELFVVPELSVWCGFCGLL